jgi:mannose-6-phosphate isomerase-like protein (cupin superfamily)
MKHVFRMISSALLLLQLTATAMAQVPAPAAAPPLEPPRQKPATPPAVRSTGGSLTLSVQVTDKSGNPIADVAVAATGPVERSAITGRDGNVAFRSMRTGVYRLRFEHDHFITLEREQTVRPQATDVTVALNPAPATVAPPAPPPEPVKPVERPSARVVEPRYMDIPGYVDNNLIRSEPQKLTTIGCTDGGTVRILQVREPLNNDVHSDFDEMVYVVAGAGVVRMKDQDTKMDPGAFMLIPRGVSHSLRRAGSKPMITLSVFMGAPCQETTPIK